MDKQKLAEIGKRGHTSKGPTRASHRLVEGNLIRLLPRRPAPWWILFEGDGKGLLIAIFSLIWMPREILSAFRKGWRKHSLYALDVDTALEMDLEDAKRYTASGVLPHESN